MNKTLLNKKLENAGKSLSICFIWLPAETGDFRKVEKKVGEALGRISIKIIDLSEKALQ